MLNETLVGRYQILQHLSSGAFTETYLAEDIHLPDRPQCKVKWLKTESLTPEAIAIARNLFQSEARTLDILGTHSQIPNLLAHFEQNQQFYIVQEFMAGEGLDRELMSGARWNELQVIAFLREVLNILQFVHQHNVIHRNLKPKNLIRRSFDGKFALIGFNGIEEIYAPATKLQSAQTQMHSTYSSKIQISDGYVPLEQMAGNPGFSSDIYALGKIAIYALIGNPPNYLPTDSQTGEVIWRPGTLVSDRTAAIIDKIVRAHPRDRYQSASEVIADLNNPQRPVFAVQPNIDTGSTFNTITSKVSNALSRINWQQYWQRYQIPLSILAGVAVLATTASISYFAFKPKDNPTVSNSTNSQETNPTNAQGFVERGNSRIEAGRYTDARADFDEAIRLDPNSVDAQFGKTLTQAFQLNLDRKYPEAIAEFDKLIALQPNSGLALVGKGNALFGQRQYDEALKAYDRATQVKPDLILGWTGRGLVLSNLKRYDEALAAYEQALKIKPDSTFALVSQGDTLRFKEQYQQAIPIYDKAIAINPNYGNAWIGKGFALNGLGQRQEAIAAIEQATKKAPNYAYTWWAWGTLLQEDGRHEGALAAAEKAISLDNQYADAWRLKANALLKLRKLPESIAAADEAVRLFPNVDTLTSQANAIYESGQFAKALPIYQRVVQIDPNLEYGWSNLSELLNQMKRYNEALTAADRALKIAPNTSGWNQRANALVGLQRYQEAIAAYDRVIKLQPDYHYAFIGKGNALYRLQRYQEAIDSYDRALAIAPVDRKLKVESDRYATLNLKGNALAQLQRYEEALKTYQQATEIKADFPEGWHNQGRMQFALQRYDAALAAYNKALEIEPDFADAKAGREEVLRQLGQ
ncbi:serine/threonine-protein kinase [Pseudanabaena sp. PCC 6802]|uniref:serine/threonine-protein kinase n=1 Tax=Pseudanabaena sp. PCC 6802 TaxID=118173 RepID=UPI00034592E0|nr:serine/threonine-protein kinase [Pseudanabaena sp. PCC 6802]